MNSSGSMLFRHVATLISGNVVILIGYLVLRITYAQEFQANFGPFAFLLDLFLLVLLAWNTYSLYAFSIKPFLQLYNYFQINASPGKPAPNDVEIPDNLITAVCDSVQAEIGRNRAEIKVYTQQVALRASLIRELKQEYEKKVYDLFTLFDVAQQLNSTLDQKKISQTMLLTCMGQMGVSSSMVFQLEEYIEYKLHVCDMRGIEIPHLEEVKLDVKSSFIKHMLTSGKGVLLESLQPEFGDDVMFQQLQKLNVRILVPFIEKNEIKVALAVGAKVTGGQFTHDDIEFLSILTNMGGLALRNAKLYMMTITDGLTKLYLPRYFVLKAEEEIKRAARYHQPLGMLMIDIDDFKKINDTHGHLEGNKILQEIAEIMVSGGPRETHIVARYGGEEFAVIMPMTDRIAGLTAAERIRKLVEQKVFTIQGKSFNCTISIGLSVFPEDGKLANQMLEAADKMLYRAKDAGKNRVASTDTAPTRAGTP